MWVGVGLCFLLSIVAAVNVAKERDPRKRKVLVVMGVGTFWSGIIIGLRLLIVVPRVFWWALMLPAFLAAGCILRSNSRQRQA